MISSRNRRSPPTTNGELRRDRAESKSRLKRERVLERGSEETGSPMRRGRVPLHRRRRWESRRSWCLVAPARELETQQLRREASGRSSKYWLQYPLGPAASTRRSGLAFLGRVGSRKSAVPQALAPRS